MRLLEVIPVLLILVLAYPLMKYDFKEHRLPNRFTYLAIGVAHGSTTLVTLVEKDFWRFGIALSISGLTFGVGYLMAKYELIGMGDIKLLISTNHILAWFAPGLVVVAITVGLILGSIYGLGLVLFKKMSWKGSMALGPFLLIGFFLTITPQLAVSITGAAGS
jgi:leader peptidase (prepilin peptidase)/N-methyltransferase